MKKKNKKIIIIITLLLLVIGAIILFTINTLNNENKLTVEEKEWLAKNINVLQNVYVVNNVDVFGKNSKGVFYDFIDNFKEEYNLNINTITYNYGEPTGNAEKSFKIVRTPNEDDVIFYKEHYVVIAKNKYSINKLNELKNKKIGILSEDELFVKNYFQDIGDISITTYESPTNLFEELSTKESIEYVIVPLEENLTSYLSSNYNICYHISDLNKYFVYDMAQDDTLSSLIKKYYASWQEEKQKDSYDKNELSIFKTALSITDKEMAELEANTYTYGFINNSPYEVLISGTYGGIISEYLSRFENFSNVEFKYEKFKKFNKFTEAIANNSIDLFFNYYNIEPKYEKIDSLLNIPYTVIANSNDNLIVNSIYSLSNKNVYIQKNTLLEKYFNELGTIKIETYSDLNELKHIIKKENVYIIIDKDTFDYYSSTALKDYNIRYSNILHETYNFYSKQSSTFNLLLNKYIQTLDPAEIRINGINNHNKTVASGTILGQIAKYSIIFIIILIIVILLFYRSSKKIKIAKKIKKDDKLKYIDQLTSLKNRNYLNENISNWNKNTIYPQATIIIDLNQVQTINDQLGYEEGDAQIKAAANVLIKTQLDNTDIMRTDGNEYLIYLVGYQEKQVVSYIRKLYKEFKNLPYEHGATIGYSMITNDIKTIEDAINESVEDMKNKKEEIESD